MGRSSLRSAFLVASRRVSPSRHDFCHPGPRKWRSTPRDVAIFSLSLFFFGRAKNLGICEDTKDSSGASFKKSEKEAAFVANNLNPTNMQFNIICEKKKVSDQNISEAWTSKYLTFLFENDRHN